MINTNSAISSPTHISATDLAEVYSPSSHFKPFKRVYLTPTSGGANHMFAEGVGPCGRDVVLLMVSESDSCVVIHQYCTDNGQIPDEFHYNKASLQLWKYYRTSTPKVTAT